jgi:integrase/recombinase XerD
MLDNAISGTHRRGPPIEGITKSPELAMRLAEFFAAGIRNPQTRSSYLKTIARLGAWMFPRGLYLETLTPIELAAYLEQLPVADTTKKAQLAAIRSTFRYLELHGTISRNPAPIVAHPRIIYRQGLTPALTRGEVIDLLKDRGEESPLGLRDLAITAVCYFTAARISAVLALDLEHLHPVGSRWLLRVREKGGHTRDLPVHPELLTILHRYLEVAELSGPLFPTAKGRGGVLRPERRMLQSDAYSAIKKRGEALGIAGVTPHVLRASAITHLLEAGAGPEIAQELAGHADLRTTMLYDRRTRDLGGEILRLSMEAPHEPAS